MIAELFIIIIALVIGAVLGYMFSVSWILSILFVIMTFIAFWGIVNAISNDLEFNKYNPENYNKILSIIDKITIGRISYFIGYVVGTFFFGYKPVKKIIN